jgi:hypothetical protein
MVLRSWKEIAVYLDRGIRTVQRWEVRLGMPVHRASSNPRCQVMAFQHELDAWIARATKPRRGSRGIRKSPVVLSTWKEIAGYLHRGVRTVQRWEATFGMPVRRLGSTPRASVVAFQYELDDWLAQRRCPPTAEYLGQRNFPLSETGTSLNVERMDFGCTSNA